ncbi:phosphohydrolase [Syntrophotalea acetylenivorans]|uniref:Phosphohydrolase n=1 Tax=Syntrophotalea acetylenivorans TaxID=1842532 RepID=A0A1L3GMU7_9BACT|nr:HDIG domain-containing metalloprotein [Syntrophotalea acetylenivorans]APG27259.1 phosphohydrolase [Syntrophotalea acetylenivorans]
MTNNDRKQEGISRKGKRSFVLHPSIKEIFSEHQQRYLLMVVLALLLTVIIIPKGGFVPGYYSPGDVASRDIKAPRDLLVPDVPLTEEKREAAAQAILPLYDFDPRTAVELTERLMALLAQAGSVQEKSPDEAGTTKDNDLAPLAGLSADQLVLMASLTARPGIEVQLQRLVAPIMARLTVGNKQVFESGWGGAIVVRDLVSQTDKTLQDATQVIGIGDAHNLLAARLQQNNDWTGAERDLLFDLMKGLMRPNLTFNQSETEERRSRARELVKPVLFQVKKGEMVVREGERVTEDQIRKLKALRGISGGHHGLLNGTGLLIGILLLLFAGHRYAKRNISKYRPNTRDLLFLVMVFIGLFILIKLAIFICAAMETAFPYIGSTSYYYAFPFAVGAMLVRIVLNSEVALIFSLIFAALLGIMFGNNLFITIYALIGSLTAAHFVRHCLVRSTLYQAGLQLSLVNVLLVLSIHLMAGHGLNSQLLYKAGFGLAGGFFCAVLVTGLVPLAETLFKYTTDIKLLELANMNTPALRELMIQAPGTYHHSIIVGNLAEAAAETINANPLMARVAAYYHDIGKIRKPLYFVENIGAQENRHDKLSPSMSALILMSHVKDGVDTARASKLGETLVDIIHQHHGTALIKFFYDKAKNQSGPGTQQVDECDYRYPGPKPQTREAALIMLADAVEAASRTLTDPTPARIQGMVQKIINNIFIDGQLDECELTLKDLHNIAKSFNRILSGIFHHRIDYPEPVHKERDKEPAKKETVKKEQGKRKSSDDSTGEPAKESKDRGSEPKKGSTEDLKRLGMS